MDWHSVQGSRDIKSFKAYETRCKHLWGHWIKTNLTYFYLWGWVRLVKSCGHFACCGHFSASLYLLRWGFYRVTGHVLVGWKQLGSLQRQGILLLITQYLFLISKIFLCWPRFFAYALRNWALVIVIIFLSQWQACDDPMSIFNHNTSDLTNIVHTVQSCLPFETNMHNCLEICCLSCRKTKTKLFYGEIEQA